MKDYISHLDAILSSTGERLLDGSGKVSHQEAMDKAQAEYKKYQAKTLTEVEKSYLDTIKMLENKTPKNKSEINKNREKQIRIRGDIKNARLCKVQPR